MLHQSWPKDFPMNENGTMNFEGFFALSEELQMQFVDQLQKQGLDAQVQLIVDYAETCEAESAVLAAEIEENKNNIAALDQRTVQLTHQLDGAKKQAKQSLSDAVNGTVKTNHNQEHVPHSKQKSCCTIL